jgi:hypothetical protein
MAPPWPSPQQGWKKVEEEEEEKERALKFITLQVL